MFMRFVATQRRQPWWCASVPLCIALCSALMLEAQTPRMVVTSTVSLDGRGLPVATTTGAGPAYHPSRALVRFRNGVPAVFLPGSGPPRAFPVIPNLYLVPTPPGLSVAEAVRRYQTSPNVLYAEPDFVVQAVATPNDPLWSQQWDMVKISAPTAWDTQTDSSDVVVGVIDTGVDFTHPDLQANLWTNPLDSSHGYTCINGSCVAGGLDDYGHGTHVAGTIGAAGNNGIGIAGINWKVRILSLKFLDSSGSGYTSDAVFCFNKVTELRQQNPPVNIRLTSNSWGGGGFSQSLKDSMAAAEAAGIVHVCAAGNSGQNADAFPMYPAAYDNRGIISVLASDQNDVGAGFTNYGLYSVDIAAPGVSTLSTVPTGVCSLCDPSGYKLLSGTSMATPHVSGVLAAMFHKNPALTTNLARDVILDPVNYDTLTDSRAQTTSTGGRLNFYKAVTTSRLFTNTLNNFPTLTMGPDVFASAGSQVNLTASASDLDAGDTLRMAWSKSGNAGSLWLFGWMFNTLFPNPTGNSVSFTAPSLARAGLVSYDASVADGRGGGAHGREYVTVSKAPTPGLPPSGTLTAMPTDAPAGSTITVNFPASDPEGGTVGWDLWIGQKNGASGSCCYTGSSTSFTLSTAGVYRIGTQAIDRELNFSNRESAVVRIGGATGDPPIASASLDKLSGPVPLTVNIDMSASTGAQYYFMNCGGGSFTSGSQSSKGICTFNTIGTYWMLLQVQDINGNNDIVSAYAVATPVPSGPDTTPPTVTITSPAGGARVSGDVTLTANASDDSSGVKKVDFYLDAGTVPIGTANALPYSFTWDSGGTSAGIHSLYAKATDIAGNIGTSPTVSITVDPPAPPKVSITSPTNPPGTVPRHSTFTINASVTPTSYLVNKVEFLVGSSVVCSIATNTITQTTYSCAWAVPAPANKSYVIQANAYDKKGVKASSTVTVTSK